MRTANPNGARRFESGRLPLGRSSAKHFVGACLILLAFAAAIQAAVLDDIGVTALRNLNPALTGTGVIVAVPEATSVVDNVDQNNYQVNPNVVGQPVSKFTYINSTGATATNQFPNGVGSASSHANTVGNNFFGTTSGVAPDVDHIYNYNANYFVNDVIFDEVAIPARVVNQSFVGNNNVQFFEDTEFDNYVSLYNTIIVSGLGNGGVPITPSTAYNVIGVAAFGGNSSVGPTYPSNSRSKPDITAPASATSFSTPYVSGSAAVLVQAGDLELGGAGTASDATDSRTIKALLLNGATKPAGWNHTPTTPLDPNHGAGIVNVFNSYQQLIGGDKDPLATTPAPIGGPYVPSLAAGNVGPQGWNLQTITSTALADAVDHYLFDLNATGTLSATITWHRAYSQSVNPPINDLDLYLFDAILGTQVAASISGVDNVEHLFVEGLAAGRYDLMVVKNGGGVGTPGVTSHSEIYALAFVVPEPSVAGFAAWVAAAIIVRRRRGGPRVASRA